MHIPDRKNVKRSRCEGTKRNWYCYYITLQAYVVFVSWGKVEELRLER